MRVLVTGGAGFIGSHVVDQLLAAGMEPVIFDLRPSPYHDPAAVEIVIGDLLAAADLSVALEGCDAVIHLAAAADVDIVAKKPAAAEQLNSRGTLAVLEAARDASVTRVVYASTIWVYGASREPLVDEETTVGLPDHLYTATKLAGEMYCTAYAELYDLECTILRFGIPYGPRARPAAVIPAFVRKALAGDDLTIAGGGRQSRRFVYVEDLAEGVVAGLRPAAANRVYNLVGDTDVTIREIADTVRDQVGDVGIVDVPARSGDFAGVEVCGRRAAAELEWTPSTPFEEGVRRYIAWHRSQQATASHAEPRAAGRLPRWRRPAVLDRLAPLALSTTLIACALGALFGYLVAASTIDVDGAKTLTVGLTSLVVLAAFLGLSLDWSPKRRPVMAALSWSLAGAYAVAFMAPPVRHALHLAAPEPELLLLTAVASGFGILLVMTGLRLRRADEERSTPPG